MRTAPFATCLAALAAAAPAQATFPGANGKIAFESYSGLPSTINVVNPDGSGETELTRGMQDRDPAWSPDGTRIAFTRYADGDAEIWVMNPDGTNQTKLTSNTAHDSEPTWTGNGIAFESWRDFGNREIYLMNTDGSSQRSLTRTEGGPYESAPSAKLGTIAYTREVIVENDIWKLSGPNLDVQAPVLSDGIDANWSPDGNRLAFARPVSRPDLWVAREDGSFQVNITNTDLPLVHETDPSWAPSGDWIVYGVDYFVDSNAERDIWITDPDGEVRRPLVTRKGISERDPDWQPLPREAGQYPRPKGATPLRTSLVPAAKPCTAPNRSHGPPLAFDACAPPVPESPNVTAGVGGAGQAPAKSVGAVEFRVTVGTPGGPDGSDVHVAFKITNVMNASDLSDYTGQLMLSTELGVTDQANSVPATMEDISFAATASCVLTADATLGAQCDLATTADSLIPGMVPEGARTIWELGPVRVYDGGPDGDTSTAGNSVFATQGVFVP